MSIDVNFYVFVHVNTVYVYSCAQIPLDGDFDNSRLKVSMKGFRENG